MKQKFSLLIYWFFQLWLGMSLGIIDPWQPAKQKVIPCIMDCTNLGKGSKREFTYKHKVGFGFFTNWNVVMKGALHWSKWWGTKFIPCNRVVHSPTTTQV